ncbi:hypothetical protein Tco_0745197 [Tanacetum coccineum]
MASGGSDQNGEYTLSKLLQMGTMAEYESEFVILANRVTGISANILKSFYIFGLKLELQRELFRSMPTTLGEAFSLAHIQFSNLEELQENQEEHICYYCWENCFSILNTKEAGNTKSPLFADTFGNSGVDDTGSEVVTGLPEEFQEGDMVDALSRVLEQKSSEKGLITVVKEETTHFLEPHYLPSSILVPVLLLIEEYGIPESRKKNLASPLGQGGCEGVGNDTLMVRILL